MITFFESICELLSQASSNFNELQDRHRRLIESWYIYLKVDLNIPGSLQQTQLQLLAHLRNKAIFSAEFVACFSGDSMHPLETDPAQVATIKRLLCALHHLELSCANVLNTDVSPSKNMISLHYELAYTLYSLASTITQDLNTLNQCSADIELLIGSYIHPLRSKLNALITTVDLKKIVTPSIGRTLQLFPKPAEEINQGLGGLGELIYQLPVYFQQLQTLIDPDSLEKSSQDDAKTLKIKTKNLVKHLTKLATGDGLSLLPSGIVTIQLLLNQLPTLLDTSGHFTKESHKKFEQILDQLRHEHLPGIIAELEGLEEHFSLRPNLLVEPTLQSMNNFYLKLVSLSEYWVAASELLDETTDKLTSPKSKILLGFFGQVKPISSVGKTLTHSPKQNILCDDEFLNVVQHRRAIRQSEAHKALGFIKENPEYKPPLYRALSEKPSIHLSHFIQHELKTWLEKNIDPTLFDKLSFDPEHIIKSTVINHEIQAFTTIPSVLFYKKLLCSLMMIQKNLEKLEHLYEKKVSAIELHTTLITDRELWSNLYYATQFIREAAFSPELSDIISKGLTCLEPLKNIPGLGDYIHSTHARPITDKPLTIDMIACWKQQNELVKQTLARMECNPIVFPEKTQAQTHEDTETDTKKEPRLCEENDLLLNIAKQIYRTPQLIRNVNPDTQDATELSEEALNKKASELMTAIKLSKCDTETLKQILLSIHELNNALSHVGVEAKSVIMAIEKKLRMSILLSADEAEFQLGYRQGAITNPLNEALSHYFRHLMLDFPISVEEKFELISNTTVIEARIEKEKARLTQLSTERDKKLTKMQCDLLSGYKQLRAIQHTMKDPMKEYTMANMEQSLLAYQTLQPYLYQIKMRYDSVLFLRELQNSHDFKTSFDGIQQMKGKVFLLLEQEKKGFDDMMRRCQDRITWLEQQKKEHEQNAHRIQKEFEVDMRLHTTFHDGDNALNLELNLKVTKQDDPIISIFHFIVNVLRKKKLTSTADHENIIDTFESTKSKWNAKCAHEIREIIQDNHSSDDIQQTINIKVNQLYSDYFHLIDAYKQLDTMHDYIKHHPSTSPEVDNEKCKWINEMKKCLSKHDISPQQRLINMAIIGMNKACKTALEKQADHPFIRLVHKLYKFFFGIDTPEQKSRRHLHNKLTEIIQQKEVVILKSTLDKN